MALTFAAFVPSSNAAVEKIDVSASKITCNTVYGTAGIKPSLMNGGTATATQITVKGTLDGCTVTSGNSAIILTSTFSGKLAGQSNDCGALLGDTPITGSITVKWKADKTTPLLQSSSVVSPTTLTGGTFTPTWTAAYGQFTLSGGSTTGAFAGSSSNVTAVTSQDLGAILAGCANPKGLKSFTLGIGQANLG